MLSEQLIEKILESGFYFDENFDSKSKQVNISEQDRQWFFQNLGIANLNSTFVDFYCFCVGGCGPQADADCLYTLEEIIENNKNSFWERKFPGIAENFLQISSIEGEHSLFYEKTTDKVYSVDWSEMNKLVSGHLAAKFCNFSEFLNWYYCA